METHSPARAYTAVAVAVAAVAYGCAYAVVVAGDTDTHPACTLMACTLLPGRTNNDLQLAACADGTTRSLIGAPHASVPLDIAATPCALLSDDPLRGAGAAYTYVDGGVPGTAPHHPGLLPERARTRGLLLLCLLVAAIAARIAAAGRASMRVHAAAGAAAVAATAGVFLALGHTALLAAVTCDPGVCAPDMCMLMPTAHDAPAWHEATCDVYGTAFVYVHTPTTGYFRASRCAPRHADAPPLMGGAVALYQMDPRVTLGADGAPQMCVFSTARHARP